MDSSTAYKETISVRTSDLAKHWHLTSKGAHSGGDQGLFICWLQSDPELHKGGFKLEVAVHENLNIPWNNLRETRR